MTALGLVTAVGTQALAAPGAGEEETTPPATQTQPNTRETPPSSESGDPSTASSPHQRQATGQGADTGETPPTANPDPSGAGSPHQRSATGDQHAGDTERSAGKDKQMAGDTKPKDKLVGLTVETSAGQPIGSVVDIVRDDKGMPTYVVIAIDNDTTAVPYETASGMVRDGKLIMNQSRLANAPKVKQSEWLDQTTSKWRTESDRYWGSTRTAQPADAPMPKER
jgi:hypothetical protein